MPSRVFTELDEKKQQKIIEASIKEFGTYGYENSSTNRIVKECGISKGSLFKYFENKEDLYFYLIDEVAMKMSESMTPELAKLPKDVIERIIAYSTLETTWYIENPDMGRLMIQMAQEKGEIGKKIAEHYKGSSTDTYKALMKDANYSNLKNDKEKVIDIVRWLLQGFNKDFFEKNTKGRKSLKKQKEDYIAQLSEYLDIMRNIL